MKKRLRPARSASRARAVTPRIPAVIEREQVLHVAKLARLHLSEDEVEQMAVDLSQILQQAELLTEVDLDGVEPTSHVIELQNVLRPDVPRPSWPRAQVLASAPEPSDGAFRVPSTQTDDLAE